MYQRDFNTSSNQNIQKLSLLLARDGFFYASIDDEKNIVSHKSHFPFSYSHDFNVSTLVSEFANLSQNAEVSIANLDSRYYHLPTETIDIDALFNTDGTFEVFKEDLPSSLGITYFAVNNTHLQFVARLFPTQSIRWSHISSLFAKAHFFEDNLCHLHMEEGQIYIFSIKNNKFSFYNQFPITSDLDALYFVLAVYKDLDFAPETMPLSITGWLATQSPIYQLLQAYIANIHFLPEKQIIPQSLDSDLKSSYYFLHHINAT